MKTSSRASDCCQEHVWYGQDQYWTLTPPCLGGSRQQQVCILQVVKEPDDVQALAKELTLRHTRVGQQRMHRLDFVYRLVRRCLADGPWCLYG